LTAVFTCRADCRLHVLQFVVQRLGLRLPASRVAVACRGILLADAVTVRDVHAALWAPAGCGFDLVLRYALRPDPRPDPRP
jgi:hypothetical protein